MGNLLVYAIVAGVGLFINYLVIKAAVKNAIHERFGDREFIKHVVNLTLLSKAELEQKKQANI